MPCNACSTSFRASRSATAQTKKRISEERKPDSKESDLAAAETKTGSVSGAVAVTQVSAFQSEKLKAMAPLCECKHPFTLSETDLLYQAALRACEDPQESDAPTDGDAGLEEPGPYHRWGGLLMIMSSMPGGLDALPPGDRVSVLRSKIDKLDQLPSPLQFADFCRVMCELELTNEDVNYLNSPLLDGLYLAYTGCPVVATSVNAELEAFIRSPATNVATLVRRICSASPPVCPAAFQLLWHCVDPHPSESPDYPYLLLAACNAHRPKQPLIVIRTIASAAVYTSDVLNQCLTVAFSQSDLFVFDTLLGQLKLSNGQESVLHDMWKLCCSPVNNNRDVSIVHALCKYSLRSAYGNELVVNALTVALSNRNFAWAHEMWAFLLQSQLRFTDIERILLSAVRSNCPHVVESTLCYIAQHAPLLISLEFPHVGAVCQAAILNGNEVMLLHICIWLKNHAVPWDALKVASAAVKTGSLKLTQIAIETGHLTCGGIGTLAITAAQSGHVDILCSLVEKLVANHAADDLVNVIERILRVGNRSCIKAVLQYKVHEHVQKGFPAMLEGCAIRSAEENNYDQAAAITTDWFEYCANINIQISWPTVLELGVRFGSDHFIKAALQTSDVSDEHLWDCWQQSLLCRIPSSISALSSHCLDRGMANRVSRQLLQCCRTGDIATLPVILDWIETIGWLSRSCAGDLVLSAIETDQAMILAHLLARDVVLMLMPLSAVAASIAHFRKQRYDQLRLFEFWNTVMPVVCHRVKDPQHLKDLLLIRAISLGKVDAAYKWLRRGANPHADNNASFILAIRDAGVSCLSTLLHWRERPHTRLGKPLEVSSSVDQCDCTLVSRGRFLVDLWSAAPAEAMLKERSIDLDTECACCPLSFRAKSGSLLHLSPPMTLFDAGACPGDHLRLKNFVYECVLNDRWLSLELCIRDAEGNIRPQLCSMLPELMSTLALVEWLKPEQYARLRSLVARRPGDSCAPPVVTAMCDRQGHFASGARLGIPSDASNGISNVLRADVPDVAVESHDSGSVDPDQGPYQTWTAWR